MFCFMVLQLRVFDLDFILFLIRGEGGDHLDRLIGTVDAIMDLTRLDVDHLPDGQVIDHPIHHDIDLALEDIEVLLHDVVIMGGKILPGIEADQSKIHAGPLHQILRTAVSESVLKIIFMYNKHISPYLRGQVSGFREQGSRIKEQGTRNKIQEVLRKILFYFLIPIS